MYSSTGMTRQRSGPWGSFAAWLCSHAAYRVVLLVSLLMPAQTTLARQSRFPSVEQVLDLAIDDETIAQLAEQYFAVEEHKLLWAIHQTYKIDLLDLCDRTEKAIGKIGLEELTSLQEELDPWRYSLLRRTPRRQEELKNLREQSESNRDDPRWVRVYELLDIYYLKIYKAQLESDRLFESFLDDVQVAFELTRDYRADMARYLRRIKLIRKRPSNYVDFSIGIDVLVLIEEARSEADDAFGKLLVRGMNDPNREQTLIEVIARLYDYEIELDSWLLHRLVKTRRPPKRDRIRVIEDHEVDLKKKYFKDAGAKWYKRFDISDRAVQSLLVVLRDAGENAAAQSLEKRYLAVLCPDLTHELFCHQLTDWADSLPQPGRELLVLAETLQADFTVRWEQLIHNAVRPGVRAKRTDFIFVGTSDKVCEYARRVYKIHRLSRATIRALLPVLTPDDRRALYNELHLHGTSRARADLLGPHIDGNTLESIDNSGPLHSEIVMK